MSQLTDLPAWQALAKHFEQVRDLHMRDQFERETDRFDRFSLRLNDILFDYSKNRITDETIRLLLDLARVNTRGAAFRETDLNTIYSDAHHRLLLTIEKKQAEVSCVKLPRLSVDGEQIANLFYQLIIR